MLGDGVLVAVPRQLLDLAAERGQIGRADGPGATLQGVDRPNGLRHVVTVKRLTKRVQVLRSLGREDLDQDLKQPVSSVAKLRDGGQIDRTVVLSSPGRRALGGQFWVYRYLVRR